MVKQGYKETEIGIIPSDWDVVRIEFFGDVISGGTPSTTITKYWNGTIPWCTPTDITSVKGIYITKTERYITIAGLENSSAFLMPPYSILLCTRATIGSLKINTIPMATNQGCKNILPNSKGDYRFLFYLLQMQKNRMLEKAIGSTFLEVSKKALCSIPLIFPSLPEQRRIAEALSDVDSLIESLEKLIHKKKAIKQGAMQELLTGKKRLPGFTGEWVEKKFSNLYDYASEGGTPSTNESAFYSGGTIPFVKIDHLSDKYILSVNSSITEPGLARSSAWLIPINSIIFSNGATIGKVSINKIPVCTKQGILGVIPSNEISCEFLYYFMSSSTFMCEVNKITTHGTMPVVYLKNLKDVKVIIPSTMDEQTAIANILSDMDSEIAELEQKLSKYRNVKTGMMQTLLTGKIRLPEEKVIEDAAIVKQDDEAVTTKKS